MGKIPLTRKDKQVYAICVFGISCCVAFLHWDDKRAYEENKYYREREEANRARVLQNEQNMRDAAKTIESVLTLTPVEQSAHLAELTSALEIMDPLWQRVGTKVMNEVLQTYHAGRALQRKLA